MARQATISTAETDSFVAKFGALREALPGSDKPWLRSLRDDGIKAFANTGVPGQKVEAWKYTNLNAWKKLDFDPSAADETAIGIDALPASLRETAAAHRLVFINGRFRADHSQPGDLPKGVRLLSLAEALKEPDDALAEHLGQIANAAEAPFAALNTAMAGDGYVLVLDPGAKADGVIEIIHLAVSDQGPVAEHTRCLIVAGAESKATIVEHVAGLGGETYWFNGVSEARLGPHAAVQLYKMQAHNHAAFHIDQTVAELADGANFECFQLSLGAALARNEVHARLVGTGANCRVSGAYALDGKQHCDTLTAIDHLATDTTSGQVFKGVLDDNAHAVFQGKIHVHPGAQGTDGQQLNKTLLLSDKAEIDTKPELEIHADDVKCSHGATAGELQEEALFYLRSRGIPEAQARGLLVEAFLDEAISEVGDETVRAAFKSAVTSWLAARNERQAA